MVVDSPTWVNDKLPMNCWNSCMSDSEGNIAKWTGDFFRIGAFVMLVCSIWASVSGMISDPAIGAILGGLIWVYAAFPLVMVIRNAGDSLAASKSDTVGFVFYDLPMAGIKAAGYVTAMIALFAAVIATLNWVLGGHLVLGGDANMHMWEFMNWGTGTIYSAFGAFTDMFGLEWVAGVVDGWANWDPSMVWGVNADGQEAWVARDVAAGSWDAGNLVGVGYQYVGVALILAKVYVVMALYDFFWSILNTLFNWIKSPYLPMKTK